MADEETSTEVSENPSELDSQETSDKPLKEEPRKFKVKVDGEEMEVDESTLIRDYQLSKASTKRLQQAAELAKEVKPFKAQLERLKSGDLDVLRELGVSEEKLYDFSERNLKAFIDYAEMSEEGKRAAQAEKELNRLKKQVEEEAKKREASDYDASLYRASQAIDNDVKSALKDADVDFKGNPLAVRRVVQDMYSAYQRGESPNAKTSLKKVLRDLDEDYSEHQVRSFKKDPKKFISSLPAEIVDEIRKSSLTEVKNQFPVGASAYRSKSKQDLEDEFAKYRRAEMAKRF